MDDVAEEIFCAVLSVLIVILFGWGVFYIASMDEGTSQDPKNIRHF